LLQLRHFLADAPRRYQHRQHPMVGEVLLVMRDLARDGMTMVVVTHEMGFAHDVADRVLFMDAGRVLERASPDDFFNRPQHPRARKFLADIRTPFAQPL
ncbi:hypothetical protein K3Z85_30270, partial [Pseudomonas aeruginosa]|nr:hypothetical protein [Pseudomonas aeruginosa]